MCPETFNLWVRAERMLCRHQQQFSSNVWAGVVVDYLVIPQVSSHLSTGNQYRDFLLHDLPKLLEDVPLAVRARMWYMHDGVPAHFCRCVRDVVKNTCHGRSTRRGGPTAWPPRSPDLNPLDFYPWGPLKTLVYEALVDTEEALHYRIVDASQTIRNYPGISERMRRSMVRRVKACTEFHGGHSEHLLQMYSFSYSVFLFWYVELVPEVCCCFSCTLYSKYLRANDVRKIEEKAFGI
jgi:hypothetical protein